MQLHNLSWKYVQLHNLSEIELFYRIRGTAVAMKNMLETQFPGINVALANYPPPAPKRILSKLVPVAQVGVVGMIMAGDQIFPRLGMSPPPWFYTLRANRFGTISAAWLFGNFLQSYLQSSGAFEVYLDGEMVSCLDVHYNFMFLYKSFPILFSFHSDLLAKFPPEARKP